jgi:hypothetical protein
MRPHRPATIAIAGVIFLALSLLGCAGFGVAIGSGALRSPELNISLGPVQLHAMTVYPLDPLLCHRAACDAGPAPPLIGAYVVVWVFTAGDRYDPGAPRRIVQLVRLPLPDH